MDCHEIWYRHSCSSEDDLPSFLTGQVKDLCAAYILSPVCQYNLPLWDSKDLRSTMCPVLILPKKGRTNSLHKTRLPFPIALTD